MKQSDFCIGIVTYFPDSETIDNLRKLLLLDIFVVIIDNTPNISSSFDDSISSNSNLKLIKNSRNLGLAIGLKKLLKVANNLSFKALLYLDQDTLLAKDKFDYEAFLSGVAKELYLKNYAIQYLSPINMKIKYGVIIGPNSGSFFNVDYFEKYNLIPNDFFVEMIDFYICLYLRRNKLKSNFLKMDDVFNHSNYGSMTYSLNLNKKYFFRLYPFKRLKELIIKAVFILYQAIKFKDLLFIFVLMEYLAKLVTMQLIAFLIFSFRSLGFIKKMNIIKDLRK